MIYELDTLQRAVIDEAREWKGTPFHHQAALKGVGCDCGGLIRGVGERAAVMSIDAAAWRPHRNYGRTPNPRQMRRVLEAFLVEVPKEDARPADVLWLDWRSGLPMHLAIVAVYKDRPTLIHALSDVGFVAEHGLDESHRARVSAVWRYPGLMGV